MIVTSLSLAHTHTCSRFALALHRIPASVRRCKTVRMNLGRHAMSYFDTIIGNTNKGNTKHEGNTNKDKTSNEGNQKKYLYIIVLLLLSLVLLI